MCSAKYRTARIILDSYQAICFLAAAKAGQAEQGWMVFAFESKLSTLTKKNAPPTSLERRLCPLLDGVRTNWLLTY
jgi:hypothetical protein